jgi:hypothetical protein
MNRRLQKATFCCLLVLPAISQATDVEASLQSPQVAFPYVLSCVLKNKNDSSISIGMVLNVEAERASSQLTGISSLVLDKVEPGIYRKSGLFSSTTLDTRELTISGTGTNSSIYGECVHLKRN